MVSQVDSDWNPATDKQAMARIHREGQLKPCNILRLFATGTIEEKILQRQYQKGQLADSIDGGAAGGGGKVMRASKV